jgi:hypothetical protein
MVWSRSRPRLSSKPLLCGEWCLRFRCCCCRSGVGLRRAGSECRSNCGLDETTSGRVQSTRPPGGTDQLVSNESALAKSACDEPGICSLSQAVFVVARRIDRHRKRSPFQCNLPIQIRRYLWRENGIKLNLRVIWRRQP